MAVTPIRHDLLLGAYENLYRDIVERVPDVNRKACEWDYFSLSRLLRNRGQRYFTIDLPEFGKVFEQSLAQGSLIPNRVPGFARLRTRRGRDSRPRLFWALLSRVFHYDGRLRDRPCTTSILFVRQLCYLMKKVKVDCAEEFTYATVADLFDIEAKMDTPDLDWSDPFSPLTNPSVEPVSLKIHSDPGLFGDDARDAWRRIHGEHYQRVFDLLVGMLPEFDAYRIVGRHGPGAVADGKRGQSKFAFPHWSERLEAIFPFDWHASTCFMQGDEYPSSDEVASRLIAVPKTAKGPRLIAAEPICNQWVQQGISRWFIDAFTSSEMSGRIIRRSVRIDDQTLNQEASRRASLGEGVTIDLSSASDRLSCWLVERVFRRKPELLSAMMACRTRFLVNDIDKKLPRYLKLRKYSTAGSALTFPVQTLVFYAISVAALLEKRGLRVNIENWRRVTGDVAVYGDDIVISNDCASDLVNALHALGLKVNTQKTFSTGWFRESCGTDWYRGENVTPSYIRSDFDPSHPSTLSTILETYRNFLVRGYRYTARFVLNRVPNKILKRIPLWDGVGAISGIYSTVGCDYSRLPKRYNRDLQRWEYKTIQLMGELDSGMPDGVDRLRHYFSEMPDSTYRWGKPIYVWRPASIGRPVPVFRERYVPLYRGI